MFLLLPMLAHSEGYWVAENFVTNGGLFYSDSGNGACEAAAASYDPNLAAADSLCWTDGNACKVPGWFTIGGCSFIECPAGEVWTGEGGNCDVPEGEYLPNCDIYDGGPSDGAGEIAFVDPNTSTIEAFCTPLYSKDGEECQDVAGTFNGHEVCNDDKNDCESGGSGTYGFVGYNGEIATAVCIPFEYADDLPTCSSTGAIVLVKNSAGEGSFVCDSPIVPTGEEDNDITNPSDEPDPNETDPLNCTGAECSDSGISDSPGGDNSTVPDVCEGACDPNDPGTWSEGSSSVSGGGNCEQQPSCQGDAIFCSMNYQLWRMRCDAEKDIEEYDQESIDAFVAANPVAGLQGDPVDLESVLTGVYNQTGVGASCPADKSISISSMTIYVPYTAFCDFATGIRPLVIFLFGFVGFRIVMRAF